MGSQELPEDVIRLLQAGRKIEAIKLLRTHWNLGLKEAKDAVEAYPDAEPDVRPVAHSRDELPADVIRALQAGRKIEAIKLLRMHWNISLREAKEAVEAYPEDRAAARPPSLVSHDPGPARLVVLVIAVVILYLVYRYFAGS